MGKNLWLPLVPKYQSWRLIRFKFTAYLFQWDFKRVKRESSRETMLAEEEEGKGCGGRGKKGNSFLFLYFPENWCLRLFTKQDKSFVPCVSYTFPPNFLFFFDCFLRKFHFAVYFIRISFIILTRNGFITALSRQL